MAAMQKHDIIHIDMVSTRAISATATVDGADPDESTTEKIYRCSHCP